MYPGTRRHGKSPRSENAMLTAGFRCAPDTLPMNKMIAITISPGATTAAVRLIVLGNACPIIPPPAATRTRKKVPSSSEKSRRHSWLGSLKSSRYPMTSRSTYANTRDSPADDCCSIEPLLPVGLNPRCACSRSGRGIGQVRRSGA